MKLSDEVFNMLHQVKGSCTWNQLMLKMISYYTLDNPLDVVGAGVDDYMRYRALNRIAFMCPSCGGDIRKLEPQLDHIYPKSKGGLDVEENFQILCSLCNNRKHNKLPTN